MSELFTISNKSPAICFAIAMLFTSTASGSVRGELLYQNHCQSCHDKNVHTREDRLATSPESLRAWVQSWVAHSQLPWSSEEIADITAYLNRTLYRFTE